MVDTSPAPVTLAPLEANNRESFIADNQEAFNYGALVEFGERNTTFEEDGQIISRATIEASLKQGQAYRILAGGRPVGGLVVKFDGSRGNLDLLFIAPDEHSKGYGQAAWALVEETYPMVTVWETFTPYFETRNVHFYVNKLGFQIVEFFNQHHPNPYYRNPEQGSLAPTDGGQAIGHQSEHHEDFLFIKNLKEDTDSHLTKTTTDGTPQRVSYADKEQLNQLINLRKLKAYRYERDSENSSWLYLS